MKLSKNTLSDHNMKNEKPKVLALIPARGGSKGVPGKNIADFGGKPMIAWTIEAAHHAELIDRIWVSTDDPEIAKCAEEYGVKVPWLRPDELATDEAPVILALVNAVETLREKEGYRPDYILLLQPNVPFRTTEDMDNVIKMAIEKDIDGVVSVCEAHVHPYLSKKINDEGYLENFIEVPMSELGLNRQNLPEAYELNGALYLVKTEILLDRKSFYGERTLAYVMPPERSIDIDTPWDMYLARLVLEDRSINRNYDNSK